MQNNRFYLLVFALSFFTLKGFTQQVGINTDGSLPNPNAILDVKSFNKGVLLPRVSSSSRLSIPNTKGLLLYDTTTQSFWYNTGSSWQNMIPGATTGTGWSLTGNIGVNGNNFLGTVDSTPLRIKVNNEPSGLLDPVFRNAFWGYNSAGAGNLNFDATDNTGIGTEALYTNADGYNCTAIGAAALYSNVWGNSNTATGAGALYSNISGAGNTANGYNALYFSKASNNTAIGNNSLYLNTTGYFNTAVGDKSLYLNSSGYNNTAVGNNSLTGNTTGIGNTAVGAYAMQTIITGNYNTAIGNMAQGFFAPNNLTNTTAIGVGAVANVSNKIRLGNAAVATIEAQGTYTTTSDGRFKYDIREDVKGLDFIMQLRPVTYHFDAKRFDEQWRGKQKDTALAAMDNVMNAAYTEAAAIRRSGFIAQEVEKAVQATGYDFSGLIKPKDEKDHYSLSYESFVVPMVKAIQELNKTVQELNKKIEQLEKENKSIKNNK